jgi:hypothetical protein
VARTDSPIMDNMQDPNRKDYGIRLGYGRTNTLTIRGSMRLKELFPDGCKVECHKTAGGYQFALTNRVSGSAVRPSQTGTGAKYVEISVYKASIEGDKPPLFAATSPVQVTKIRGGLMLLLPETLEEPAKRGHKVGKVKKQSKAETTATAGSHLSLVSTTPQQEPAQEQPVEAVAGEPVPLHEAAANNATQVIQLPEISLRTAIQAVNAWKRLTPDKVSLSITARGTNRCGTSRNSI